ncbi:Penicillin-binding protein, dimerization domain protein, partial [mine drainage metagenome]
MTLALNNSQFSPYEPTPVAFGISKQIAIDVQEHSKQFPGVITELTTQRTYPEGTTAAQVLGYVGQIKPTQLAKLSKKGYTAQSQIGLAGVEATYESYLRGVPGQTKLEVTASGNVVGTLGETAAKPGGNLVLSIDTSLQKAVEQALGSEIKALSHTYDPYFH